jgi:hypothetical protein
VVRNDRVRLIPMGTEGPWVVILATGMDASRPWSKLQHYRQSVRATVNVPMMRAVQCKSVSLVAPLTVPGGFIAILLFANA